MWLGVDLRTGTIKISIKRDWITCSEYATILGSIVSMIGGAIYDNLMSTMIMRMIFI